MALRLPLKAECLGLEQHEGICQHETVQYILAPAKKAPLWESKEFMQTGGLLYCVLQSATCPLLPRAIFMLRADE